MLYNRELKRVRTDKDCISCPYFNKLEKKCEGIGKCCFEIDPITQTLIDPITKLAIKLDKGE